MPTPKPVRVEPTRARFRALVAANPNYFGTAPQLVGFPVVAAQKFKTTYEQLTCIAYSPQLDRLEATFVVKLPNGYSGGPCTPGSYEHVRFYIDYGAGWEDAGLASVNVHDIPVGTDCHKDRSHPLAYTCGVDHQPRRDWCGKPVLPRMRAILSWNWMPPANQPDWVAPWGNRLECNAQIQPRPRTYVDAIGALPKDIVMKLKLPVAGLPESPLPLPPQLPAMPLEELAEAYKGLDIPEHRFALPHVMKALAPSADQFQLTGAAIAAKVAGISLQNVIDTLDQDAGNTNYEKLGCLGLEHQGNTDRLVATFNVSQKTGYSGGPCTAGSTEYVAFWADWDDDCKFEYLGTVETNVHDYSTLPNGGLCYAAVLPVDLNRLRQSCDRPVLRHVRAVLSWGTPPSTTDPNRLPHWGNRLDTHVQIAPGPRYDGSARFVIVGGVPAAEIASSGLTLPVAHLAVNGSPLDARGCPFAGRVTLHGPTDPALVGKKYRIMVRPATGSTPVPLMTPLKTVGGLGQTLPSTDPLVNWTPDSNGWFTWRGWTENTTGLLGWFDTSDDAKWVIELELADPAGLPVLVDTKMVQLDNTLPNQKPGDTVNTADLSLNFAGQCTVLPGKITGHFDAHDKYFGSWDFTVRGGPAAGFTQPPIKPMPALAKDSETPLGGQDLELDLTALPPCGYSLTLSVSDRAVVNSAYTGRSMSISRGFCIRNEE